jgi:hypothetical protein
MTEETRPKRSRGATHDPHLEDKVAGTNVSETDLVTHLQDQIARLKCPFVHLRKER